MRNKKRLLIIAVVAYFCLSIPVVFFFARNSGTEANPEPTEVPDAEAEGWLRSCWRLLWKNAAGWV